MKRLLISVLILLVFTCLMSCSSDDDNATSNDTLSGTWKLTALNTTTAYDWNNDGTTSINILNEVDCLQNETLVFESNNMVMSNNTSFLDLEIELVAGTTDEFTFYVDCEEDIYSYSLTYTREGNSIVFNDEGDLLEGTISGNTISFAMEGDIDVETENGTSTTEDITLVYTKQ